MHKPLVAFERRALIYILKDRAVANGLNEDEATKIVDPITRMQGNSYKAMERVSNQLLRIILSQEDMVGR